MLTNHAYRALTDLGVFHDRSVRATWQLLSSWMTNLLSLLISHTQMNSASRWPWKNRLRIRSTTAAAERPLGTLQFSMSQNTPTGGIFSGPPVSGEPVRFFVT